MKLNGDKVKNLRKRMGLSQEQLAILAKVTGAYISIVEKGEAFGPKYETVINLAKALHVKPEELVINKKAV